MATFANPWADPDEDILLPIQVTGNCLIESTLLQLPQSDESVTVTAPDNRE